MILFLKRDLLLSKSMEGFIQNLGRINGRKFCSLSIATPFEPVGLKIDNHNFHQQALVPFSRQWEEIIDIGSRKN